MGTQEEPPPFKSPRLDPSKDHRLTGIKSLEDLLATDTDRGGDRNSLRTTRHNLQPESPTFLMDIES